MIVKVRNDNEKSVFFASNCTLGQDQAMRESIVVVIGVQVEVLHVIVLCLGVHLVQGAKIKSAHRDWLSDDVLEVDRVSHDDVLSLIQLDDELIEFNKVLAVVVQLLFVVDACAQEDSDDTHLLVIGVNVDCDGELLGVEATSASDNVNVPCVHNC